jgi:hypothetical protein
MTQWLVIERPASRSGSWSVTPRRPADSAAAASEGSSRGRLLAAVRVRVAAGQLGPIATPASAVTPVPLLASCARGSGCGITAEAASGRRSDSLAGDFNGCRRTGSAWTSVAEGTSTPHRVVAQSHRQDPYQHKVPIPLKRSTGGATSSLLGHGG